MEEEVGCQRKKESACSPRYLPSLVTFYLQILLFLARELFMGVVSAWGDYNLREVHGRSLFSGCAWAMFYDAWTCMGSDV